MNVRIDVEITPEEMRRLMGLPDVQEFNKEVMSYMLKKMQEGAEGFDPMGFFRHGVVGNMDVFRQWMDAFGKFGVKS